MGATSVAIHGSTRGILAIKSPSGVAGDPDESAAEQLTVDGDVRWKFLLPGTSNSGAVLADGSVVLVSSCPWCPSRMSPQVVTLTDDGTVSGSTELSGYARVLDVFPLADGVGLVAVPSENLGGAAVLAGGRTATDFRVIGTFEFADGELGGARAVTAGDVLYVAYQDWLRRIRVDGSATEWKLMRPARNASVSINALSVVPGAAFDTLYVAGSVGGHVEFGSQAVDSHTIDGVILRYDIPVD